MSKQKTIEDVIEQLQKIINPLMLLTAHFDVLKMFIDDCQYDGALIEQQLDLLEDYYETYNEVNETQQRQLIDEAIQQGLNPIYLHDWFITYDKDLEVMKNQDSDENKEYMEQLTIEVTDPTELIKDVKAYTKTL